MPSARRKFVVPPPLAGTAPLSEEVNALINAVTCACVRSVGEALDPETLPLTVLLAIAASLVLVTAAELMFNVMEPLVVTGEPLTERSVELTPTEVTVPVETVAQDASVPFVVRNFPEFEVCDGARALKASFAEV